MKRLLTLLLLCAVPAVAPSQDTSALRNSGRLSIGPQVVDNNTNSSKLTEYRDLRSNRYPVEFRLSGRRQGGLFLDLTGDNVTRRDQTIGLAVGSAGLWRLDLGWNETPHNLSNKAQSVYSASTPGMLDVSQVVTMPLKKLATAATDIPLVLRSDTLVAAYALAFARPIALANQTKTGTMALHYTGVDALDVSVDYTRRAKTGSHPSYGPIGDRPPRTLNIQLAEPVEYLTGDLKVAAEYDGGTYQGRVDYLVSDFSNDVGTLVWRNVYATPPAGSTIDTWDRLVSSYGRRPLPPDNRYQNASISGGASLPFESRLSASVSFGRMEQNETLLPYSYAPLTTLTLPRATADARMNTRNISAEYSMVPVRRVNLRAFFRRFDLENETPRSQWQYVTSDVSNLAGTVTFLNKRYNEPIAWDRQNAGVDATWRLGLWKSSIGFGFEREDVGRVHREAEETAENILRASWRLQPMRWLSLRAKALRGNRDGGTYDWRVPRESYWYTLAEAGADNNNPQFTFENHPDMRRSDISDRRRDQVDFTAGLTPGNGTFTISTTFTYRRDDFDSDVRPEQPLRGRLLADSLATSPGDQLGLLDSQRRQLGLDLSYAPVDRLSMNAALGWDAGDGKQRGMEFNENNKQNPSTIAAASLGPWTRAGSQWTAKTVDQTKYVGIGGAFDVRPNMTVSANYTASVSTIDITYAGFGVTNWDGTAFASNTEFAFETPAPVTNDSHIADLRLEFPLVRDIAVQLGYQYDFYRVRDWQQETGTKQFEAVNTELLLRDTSREFRWGNRLFNMSPLLAPSYTAHSVFARLTYKF